MLVSYCSCSRASEMNDEERRYDLLVAKWREGAEYGRLSMVLDDVDVQAVK